MNSPARSIVEGALLGAAAGGVAVLLEAALAVLTAGPMGFPPPSAWIAYTGGGAAIAALVSVFCAAVRRVPSRWTPPALAFAALAVPAVAERGYRIADVLGGSTQERAAAAAVGLVAYGLFLGLVGLCARPRQMGVAAAIGVPATTLMLAIHRNLITDPAAPTALALDAAAVIVSLFVARQAHAAAHRGWIAGATAAVVTLAGFASGPRILQALAPDVEERRPHLLIVMVDTLRQDVFRDVVDTTPEGAAFREAFRGSAWFDQAIAAAPWTSPSVGSIMSGRYPAEHGWTRDFTQPGLAVRRLPEPVRTLAQSLDDAGYYSAGFITNGYLHPRSGINRGFAEYHMLRGASATFPVLEVAERLGWLKDAPYQPADVVRRSVQEHLPWLLGRHQPLFLWIHMLDPHYPLYEHPALSAEPGREAASEIDRMYRGETRFALAEVAKLVTMLDEAGVGGEALLLFVSDHGEMLPSDGRVLGLPGGTDEYGHGTSLYDEQLRVPLLIRPPGGLDTDREVSALVSHIDLVPTIGEMVGVELGLSGPGARSVAGFVSGTRAPDPARRVLAGSTSHKPMRRAVRGPSSKVIEYPDGEQGIEIYDLATDPLERSNLVTLHPERDREGEGLVDRLFGALESAPEAELQEMDEATRENLEALGYVE